MAGFVARPIVSPFSPGSVSTGYTLQVPLFVAIGDKIKIDTRTGEYIERAN